MMITNVPNFLTQGSLVSLLEDLTVCMRGTFDFFYCPWDPHARNGERAVTHSCVNSCAPEPLVGCFCCRDAHGFLSLILLFF